MMKICGISDMHGKFDFEIKPCDIVLICGDILPLDIQHNLIKSEEWIISFFIPWCTNLPCEKVVFIGGNHDKLLMKAPGTVREVLSNQDKVIYLDSETYEYKGKTIYGTPWCKPFYEWSFMEAEEASDERYKNVTHIDILMSHDAPYGISDVILQKDCFWADGSHIGNHALTKLIEKTTPTLCLHGHLHSTNHEQELLGSTMVYNVSLLNENYKMTYEPLYIELA